MKTLLVMFTIEGERRDFPLRREVVIVGRMMDCDLRVPVPSVSRNHCQFELRDNGVYVKDLQSSNGTFVNNRRVHDTVELQAGDLVSAGPVHFTVTVDGEPQEFAQVRSVLPKTANVQSKEQEELANAGTHLDEPVDAILGGNIVADSPEQSMADAATMAGYSVGDASAASAETVDMDDEPVLIPAGEDELADDDAPDDDVMAIIGGEDDEADLAAMAAAGEAMSDVDADEETVLEAEPLADPEPTPAAPPQSVPPATKTPPPQSHTPPAPAAESTPAPSPPQSATPPTPPATASAAPPVPPRPAPTESVEPAAVTPKPAPPAKTPKPVEAPTPAAPPAPPAPAAPSADDDVTIDLTAPEDKQQDLDAKLSMTGSGLLNMTDEPGSESDVAISAVESLESEPAAPADPGDEDPAAALDQLAMEMGGDADPGDDDDDDAFAWMYDEDER